MLGNSLNTLFNSNLRHKTDIGFCPRGIANPIVNFAARMAVGSLKIAENLDLEPFLRGQNINGLLCELLEREDLLRVSKIVGVVVRLRIPKKVDDSFANVVYVPIPPQLLPVTIHDRVFPRQYCMNELRQNELRYLAFAVCIEKSEDRILQVWKELVIAFDQFLGSELGHGVNGFSLGDIHLTDRVLDRLSVNF